MKVSPRPDKPAPEPSPTETPSLTGTIVWRHPTRKYGFLRPDSSLSDIFIPAAAIQGEGVPLVEGQRVAFRIGKGPKGPMAIDVCPERYRREM